MVDQQTAQVIDNREQVMVGISTSECRVVHTTKKHPQIGWINFEGKRQKVYVGFWGDCPVWKLARGDDDPEYVYCAERTVDIEDDPDYCGDESDNDSLPLEVNVR